MLLGTAWKLTILVCLFMAGAWVDGHSDPYAAPVEASLAPAVSITTTTTAPSVDFPFDLEERRNAAPQCWEDEVVVMVIWDPYEQLDNFEVGCVPADNLPVTGYRP